MQNKKIFHTCNLIPTLALIFDSLFVLINYLIFFYLIFHKIRWINNNVVLLLRLVFLNSNLNLFYQFLFFIITTIHTIRTEPIFLSASCFNSILVLISSNCWHLIQQKFILLILFILHIHVKNIFNIIHKLLLAASFSFIYSYSFTLFYRLISSMITSLTLHHSNNFF